MSNDDKDAHDAADDNVREDLISFRTTWLRAIAYAWNNDEFKHDLLTGDAAQVIEEKFGVKLGWTSVLHLMVAQQYGQQIQWMGDDWAFPEVDEILTLRVPLEAPRAARADARKHAIALADYYRVRPSLFGTTKPTTSGKTGFTTATAAMAGATSVFSSLTIKCNAMLQEAFEDAAPPSGSGVEFASRGPLPNGFVPTGTSFFDLGVAMTYVMAKAWENEAFRRLIQDPKNAMVGLGRARGFVSPWAIKLAIRNDPEAVWHDEDPSNNDPNKRASHWDDGNFTAHELVLNLPVAPEEARDYSVALAAYNSTGAQFPFTCCP